MISCVALDVSDYDKPPPSLAFLAGACEKAQQPYQCFSFNSAFLDGMSIEGFNEIYTKIKLGVMNELPKKSVDIIDSIVEQINSLSTTTVVVSLFSYVQYPIAKFFLEKLKKVMPTVEVIAGGPGVQALHASGTTIGKNLLDSGLVDYYCLGEGDVVLVEFLQGVRSILGVNSKQDQFETWVPQINDLDAKYVIPSYKKMSLTNYQNIEGQQSTVFSLSTSRGCVRACSFCDVAKSWPKFRYRKGTSVAQEILTHHRDVGAVHFTIVDSLINGSLKSFKEFNHEMIKLKSQYPSLKEFSYNGMFIVRDRHTHNEEFFATMKAAGCESLAIGVETGSERLRFDMNKKFTNRDLDHHLEMCQKYGIRNSLLMFVGYPTETAQDFEDTLEMLDRYQKYLIDSTIIGITFTGVFRMIPDTPVFDHRDDIGLVIDEQFHSDEAMHRLNWVNTNNPDLTVKERILRDLKFRKRAIELRYPIPYSQRYLEYLKYVDRDLFLMLD
jgi:radical SAM superfamily enzyme YgiQ (UPF0313 family)